MTENFSTERVPPDHQLPAHAEGGGKPRKNRLLVWLLMFVVFGGVLWWVMHQKSAPAAAGGRRGGGSGPVATETVTATQGDIGVYQDAIGTVTPVYTDSIVSQVTGVVTAVHYKEGQLVHKGEPLVQIDARPYAATLKQAQGSLQRDQNLLAEAKMDLARYREAWARNAIAKQQLDDQEKLVLQYQGTVKNDQGTVDYGRVQLGFTHIDSPINGRVGLRLVDPGNLVSAGGATVLAVITQLQPITVVFTISEDNLQTVIEHMKQKQGLEVQALDRTQQTIISKGKLLSTDNQIDTTTGTVKLRAVFDNKDEILFPNQFVNARLLVETLRGVTLLPSSAIQHNGEQAFVWLIQNGTANQRNVTTGVTDNNQTQVTGINPGDVVANSSFEKLQPGSKVVAPQPADGGKGSGAHGQHGQGGKGTKAVAGSPGGAGSSAP
jgi:multidrug efflux system membrane fusion protein